MDGPLPGLFCPIWPNRTCKRAVLAQDSKQWAQSQYNRGYHKRPTVATHPAAYGSWRQSGRVRERLSPSNPPPCLISGSGEPDLPAWIGLRPSRLVLRARGGASEFWKPHSPTSNKPAVCMWLWGIIQSKGRHSILEKTFDSKAGYFIPLLSRTRKSRSSRSWLGDGDLFDLVTSILLIRQGKVIQ